MFKHKYRYWFVIGLSLYTYLNTIICQLFHYFNIEIDWYVAFGTIILLTLGIWESNKALYTLFEKNVKKSDNKIRNLGYFFIAGCTATTILTCCIVLFVSKVIYNYQWANVWIPLKLNLIYAWLACLLFHLMNAVWVYFREYRAKVQEAEELKNITAQAELQLIKSQINPHFLFNNLNVLSTLVLKNSDEANEFIEQFSKVYRYILTHHKTDLVPLRKEVEFIKPYVFLLEKRFASSLDIQIKIDEEIDDLYIIPAALQMLIENAIKHNVVSKSKPLTIIVSQQKDEIIVSNNLQLRESVLDSTKLGLTNISKRYKSVSDRDVEVMDHSGHFSITLPLLHLN